ncbi:hypothetical protein ACRAWD_07535 [Caulobacter segnis]
MRVGVTSEIKPGEHRVGLTPTAVREYVGHGHTVLVQSGAGLRRRLCRRRLCEGRRDPRGPTPRRSSPART